MQAGDIILTRNLKEEDNGSPGYWNHAAIYCGKFKVIEAQAKPNEVLRVSWFTFEQRYPEIIVVRFPIDSTDKMVSRAEQLIGKPYRKFSSLFFRSGWLRNKMGYNCVGVIKECYRYATGNNIKWRFPDDILKTPHKNIWKKPLTKHEQLV